jgi:acyl carrier protein
MPTQLSVEEITRDVIALIHKQARIPLEKLKPETDFRAELRLDSLTGLKVLAAIEKKFGIAVPDLEIDKTRTVAAAVALVQRCLAQ